MSATAPALQVASVKTEWIVPAGTPHELTGGFALVASKVATFPAKVPLTDHVALPQALLIVKLPFTVLSGWVSVHVPPLESDHVPEMLQAGVGGGAGLLLLGYEIAGGSGNENGSGTVQLPY